MENAQRGGGAGESGSTTTTVQPGQPGGVVVQTYQETATVTKIDKQTREITLRDPDGTESIVKAGPEVANFDQIHVGDRVKTTLTEQLAIAMRDPNEPPSSGGRTSSVALAPKGAKPGIVTADTVEMTVTVTALDPQRHLATVQFPNGQSKTFRTRDDVDLAKRHVGEQVVIRSTETMAISVEKE